MQTQNLVAFAKKHRPLVIAGAALLIVLVVIFLRFDELETKTNELEDRRKTYARLQRNIAGSAHLEAQLQEIRDLNARIAQRAFSPGELARNLQFFYQLEKETGVKFTADVQQLTPPPLAKGAKPNYLRLPFRLTISGDYHELLVFLAKLEHELVTSNLTLATLGPDSTAPENLPGRTSRPLQLQLTIEALAHNNS